MKYILPLALAILTYPVYANDMERPEQKEKKDRLDAYQFMLAQPTSDFYAEIPHVQEVGNDSKRPSVVTDNKENPPASAPMDLFAQKTENASVEIPSSVNLHTPTDQIVSNMRAVNLEDVFEPELTRPVHTTRSNPNPPSDPVHLPNCENECHP